MKSDSGATMEDLGKQARLLLFALRQPEAEAPDPWDDLPEEAREYWGMIGAIAIEQVQSAKNLHFTSLAKILSGYGQESPEVLWEQMPVSDKLAWEGVARLMAQKIDGEEEWDSAIDVAFWRSWHAHKLQTMEEACQKQQA